MTKPLTKYLDELINLTVNKIQERKHQNLNTTRLENLTKKLNDIKIKHQQNKSDSLNG